MAAILSNPGEEAQLLQTIEMFEVIVQSQPQDCQSLDILKEAYTKLGREEDAIRTSKRIAEAYTQMGQLSWAILEYETVLQRRPNDTDVQKALKQIEDKASNATTHSAAVEPAALTPPDGARTHRRTRAAAEAVDDGQAVMRKIFAESRVISAGDFDLCWRAPDLASPPEDVVEPFIQTLSDKKILPVEQSLKLLADKSRAGFLPLEKYDVDADLLRGFPADACRRWCVVPFDRMSKSVLVATANPFNQQAAKDLSAATSHRLLWYLAPPLELMKIIRRVFH